MLTECRHPLFEPGDVWRYQTRPGEERSLVTIVGICLETLQASPMG
jgi:hypothetical protein